MLDKLIHKIRSMFPTKRIVIPSLNRPSPDKEATVRIIRVGDPQEAADLRDEVKGSEILFINVYGLIGNEKEQFIKRLKIQCEPAGKEIYGIDRNWVVVTGLKVEGTGRQPAQQPGKPENQ